MTPTAQSLPAHQEALSLSEERRRAPQHGARPRPRAGRADGPAKHEPPPMGRALGRYTSGDGRPRELVARPGAGDSVLVIDRDAATLCDRRLVAHLAADEPSENVAIVCRHYLADDAGRWCRRVEPEDLETAPFADPRALAGRDGGEPAGQARDFDVESEVTEALGSAYRLALLALPDSSSLQLRWSRRAVGDVEAEWEPAGLRELVGTLESYEPPLTLTATALARYDDDPRVSLKRLRGELERMCASPIVLNRGLREAVLRTISTRGTSLSEIARRCGMVKRDRRGRLSGETSWLARRIGLMPEGGESAITPWVHSEVLALIARRGLGISPREVEL
jgi:hypothetical protein